MLIRLFVIASIAAACGNAHNPDLPTVDGSAGGSDAKPVLASAHRSCHEDSGVILDLTPELEQYRSQGFTRYAYVEAPGGSRIPIIAQDQISAITVTGPNGTDTLRDVERLHFADVIETVR